MIEHLPNMPQNVGIASRNLGAMRIYAESSSKLLMHERQKPIAEWMRSVISRRKISARAWTEAAGMGKDTVSRALRDDYENVTSTRSIAQLADAINEVPFGAAASVPSEASLVEILQVLLSAYTEGRAPGPDSIQIFAASLRETLLHLADEPSAVDDPKSSQLLARMIVRRAGL